MESRFVILYLKEKWRISYANEENSSCGNHDCYHAQWVWKNSTEFCNERRNNAGNKEYRARKCNREGYQYE